MGDRPKTYLECGVCSKIVDDSNAFVRMEAHKNGWYYSKQGDVWCPDHRPSWAPIFKKPTRKQKLLRKIKLSKEEQQLADKLTDAGLDQEHAEEWLKDILVARMLRMKKLPE